MFLLILAHILNLLNYSQLHKAGYRGEGITIAVIDCGFYRANDPTVFPQERIIGVYDLLAEEETRPPRNDMFSDSLDFHGTSCLSTMLYSDQTWTGTAPEANYILIRAEDKYVESREEVSRLARAFHLADSLDADIVTVSLGYSQFDDTTTNYTYEEMDGRSEAAQAALELARHNRIVCVAVGNEGNKSWYYLTTPADADSILAVGAADQNGTICAFSSYGPTADGRVKPEIVGWGGNCPIYNPAYIDPDTGKEGILGISNGSSFSTPQIAGLMACLKQAMPQMSAMELRQAVIESASLYPQYNFQQGYGIPDIGYVFNGVRNDLEDVTSPDIDSEGCHKYFRNGMIIISKDGEQFTPLGIKLKP